MKTSLCVASILVIAGCGDSNKPVMCSAPGGPVAGAADTHCGAMVQATNPASCHPPMPDAGPPTDAGTGGSDFGATMYGTEGDDDDCKYHISYTVTTVCENADVFFTAVVKKKTDNSPLTGAMPDLEVFLNDTHPAPNSNQSFTESPPGTYRVGPIRFDASGMWTVRWHFFHDCDDTVEDSPHGHGAFFLNVP